MTQRPLSPHLQIYRPQLTTVLSILHRMAGFALAVGTAMVTWWLVAAASGAEAYDTAMRFAAGPFGQFLLFGWSAALYYHMCNGVRHLIWDTGRLLDLKGAYRAGYTVLAVAAALQVFTWWQVWFGQPLRLNTDYFPS